MQFKAEIPSPYSSIAPYDPTCGGHDINVYLTGCETRYAD
jgi:hypothetical protein